jgi:sec-independent protein translocase protein TatA
MTELLVVFAIIMLLFGAKRLPALADGMGKAIRNFKRGLSTEDEDVTPPDKQVTEQSSAEKLERNEARADTKS